MKRLPSPAELALTASAVAITGFTAYFLTTRKGGILTGTYANPLPVPSSSAVAKRIPAVAERLKRIWPDVTGEKEMPPAALEIALAQAWGESGVGGWWTDKSEKGQGNMIGSENLGARQCSRPTDSADYYTCVPYGDTVPQPDGSQKAIDASFMYFKAGKTPDGKDRDAADAAAWQFIKDITKTWPALDELKSGDVMAYAKRQGPKSQGGNGYYQGFGATMDERVTGYARAIASHIPAVAAALGHKKVYAKILPELLAAGSTYKPTAGFQLAGSEIALALHLAGVLPRARIVPGPRGRIVWYIEQPELGAAPPRDVVISEQEALAQDAVMRGANATGVEGVGTVIVGIFAGIIVASGVALAVAKSRAEKLLGGVRAAGYDVVLPNGAPKQDWIIVDASDPAFGKLRVLLGEDLFEKALAAGIKFQRPAKVSGYSRWGRAPIGDWVDDLLKTGTAVAQTVEQATATAQAASPATPAAPSAPTPAPPPPPSVSPTVINAAVAAGAAVVVLLAVAAAWRIAKPRLGESRAYPSFAWMASLPDDAVSTLRSGVPLNEQQIRSLSLSQCETIVDHALLMSSDRVPDPSTWFLIGDDRAPLSGVAETVEAVAVVGTSAAVLVGAIWLYKSLFDKGGWVDTTQEGLVRSSMSPIEPTVRDILTDPTLSEKQAAQQLHDVLQPGFGILAGSPRQPRWIRWIKPEIGDGVQANASSAKKIVDDIADKYASKDAAKVVGSTTGGLLTGLSIGTALGTAFPGLGNVVGAAVGAIIGALAGLISGILGLDSKEAIALAAEINKFNQRVHAALATVPPEARAKLGAILVDAMRKHVGPYALCVGPNAAGDSDIACVMTSIEGIREAASSLDADVQKWILQYEAETQAAKTRRYKRVAATAGGITVAALAALAVAVKTGHIVLGDAEPKYAEFQWMAGFPPDAIATLRSGAPLDSGALRRLTRDQRRALAAHAGLDTKDGAIDPASWRLTE